MDYFNKCVLGMNVLVYKTADWYWIKVAIESRLFTISVGRICLSISKRHA